MRMMSDVLIQTWMWGGRRTMKWEIHEISFFFLNTLPTPVCSRFSYRTRSRKLTANLSTTCWGTADSAQSVCAYEKERESKSEKNDTFFRSFPRMWQSRLTPSKHMASNLPFPNIFITWAYSEKNKMLVEWWNFFLITSHQLLMK